MENPVPTRRPHGALRAPATSATPTIPTASRRRVDSYGATFRTLGHFIGSYQELVAVIRDFMLPSPG